MRPVVTPAGGAPGSAHSTSRNRPASAAPAPPRARARTGVTVRQLDRGADDGYHSGLVPGLRSSVDAQRLASELAFAAQRLATLAAAPPGLYARVADPALGVEERSWLAFQIAYIGPLDGPDPFASLEAAVTTWGSGEAPALDQLQLGPRSSHEAGRGTRTIDAYRAWVARAGSQEAAFTGDAAWTPDRRFARVFERLSLPGLTRGARFDLLVTLGALGVHQLSAGLLAFGGSDEVTIAAKRLLGIGDTMLLERRAADLAGACGIELAALDVGFYNWERGERAMLGVGEQVQPDPAVLGTVADVLGL